jgi:hypothetical protein
MVQCALCVRLHKLMFVFMIVCLYVYDRMLEVV